MVKLSACYIVKNEARVLRKSMASLQEAVDEFIVVDTGSEDDTVAIAKEFGASIHFLPWEEDFSKPRNLAVDKATGDWIIFLDADEYYPDEVLPKLRLLIQSDMHNMKVGGLMAPRVDLDAEHDNSYIDESKQCRIFRRGSRYRGSIHEQLILPKGMIMLHDERLLFYHTGYSTSVVAEKLRRNLFLLEKKMKANEYTLDPMDFRYLMDCYYGLGDMEKAFAMSSKCLAYRMELAAEISYIYKIRVKSAVFAGFPQKLVLQILQEAVQYDKGYFLLLTGLYFYEQGEKEKFLPYLMAGMEVAAKASKNNPCMELLPQVRSIMAQYVQ